MKDLLWAIFGTLILVGVILGFNKTVYGMSSGELLAGVNQVRASHNAPPLVYNQQLTNSAIAKGQDMCSKNYWEHGNWISFINASGYPYLKASENLAHGFATAQATINGWINSPSHFANMIDPALRDTGFGIVGCAKFQKNTNDVIVVEHFGVRSSDPAIAPKPSSTTIENGTISNPTLTTPPKPVPIKVSVTPPENKLYKFLISAMDRRTFTIIEV